MLRLARVGKLEETVSSPKLKKEWTSLPGADENAKRRTAGGKPMDFAYLKSLFDAHLTEEKRKVGL